MISYRQMSDISFRFDIAERLLEVHHKRIAENRNIIVDKEEISPINSVLTPGVLKLNFPFTDHLQEHL